MRQVSLWLYYLLFYNIIHANTRTIKKAFDLYSCIHKVLTTPLCDDTSSFFADNKNTWDEIFQALRRTNKGRTPESQGAIVFQFKRSQNIYFILYLVEKKKELRKQCNSKAIQFIQECLDILLQK